MQCGGFRISYRSDERIFDTMTPIIGVLLLIGPSRSHPGSRPPTGSTC